MVDIIDAKDIKMVKVVKKLGEYMKSSDSWHPEYYPRCNHNKHKYCCCGGHNHSTRKRFLYRLLRKYRQKEEMLNGCI